MFELGPSVLPLAGKGGSELRIKEKQTFKTLNSPAHRANKIYDVSDYKANQFKETLSPKFDDTPKPIISMMTKYTKPLTIYRHQIVDFEAA